MLLHHIIGNKNINVIDGGYRFQRVVWHRNKYFEFICKNYVRYVQNHYVSNTVIDFDGYHVNTTDKNTKSQERQQRQNDRFPLMSFLTKR